ncbi:MAG: hypothetical protein HW421_1792 [Ignavibacteria bacterium]|nr:hypothetical protein [Ignavibacteria bacterium]
MGMFQIKVKVTNPSDSSRFFEAEFCIDTGALYSFVPEEYLEKIGFERNLVSDAVRRNF